MIALNIAPAGLTKVRDMQSAISNFVRIFVAIALSLGSVASMRGGECGAGTAGTACGCCKNAGVPSCCRAPENEPPAQQPAEPASRDSLGMQPLDLHARAVAVIVPPATIVIFSGGKNARCAAVAGHTFQSVRCMRMI